MVAVERGRGPTAPRAFEPDLGRRDRPHDRIVGLRRVQLHQLPDPPALLVEALVLARDVEEPVVVDDDRPVRVVARPEPEHAAVVAAAVEQVGDVPSLHQTPGVREVRDAVVERHGVLDRDLVVADIREELIIEPRDRRHDARIDRDLPAVVIAAVELHDIEPAVLAALQEVVAQDQRRPVPVVVPHRPRHAGVGVDGPEHRGTLPVHRDDAEQVVAGARVVQRVSLRVGRGGTLRQVAGLQLGPDRPARPAVQEVVVPVIRALADLDRSVLVHDHVRLAGPPRAAPHAWPRRVRRRRARSAALRVVPADDRVHRDRSLAVVVPCGVPPERRDPGERGVDGTGCRHAGRW